MKLTSWLIFPAIILHGPAVRAEDSLTYEKQIRPILKAYCFECHGEGEKLRGQLDLRLRRLMTNGGVSGPALILGQSKQSLIFQKVTEGAMPPGKKKLNPADIALLGRWIDAGAPVAAAEPAQLGSGLHITALERAFWAFQPILRPSVPLVANKDRVRTPIDAFLLSRLEAQGLAFRPEADRRTLIRRATLDLLGLPPTPEEVDAFVKDPTAEAYERLVDRLLASPHYGERWGRHWLDVAGYADSDGASSDDPIRPYAYHYRDYVLRAFNADLPWDRFILEQLAGDELVTRPYRNLNPEDIEKLTATGFLRMPPDGTGAPGGNQVGVRHQVLADTVEVVSTALLGLTVGCAQCHNHRYDPIPQTDYYRIRSLFEPGYDPTQWRIPSQRLVSLATDADREVAKKIEAEAAKIDSLRLAKQQEYIDRTFDKEVAKLPEGMQTAARQARATPDTKRTPEQKRLMREHPSLNVSAGSLYLYDSKAAADLKEYADRSAAVRARKPVEEFVAVLDEVPGRLPTSRLLHRGLPDEPREVVSPGGLLVLEQRHPLRAEKDPMRATSGRRLALARWMIAPEQPLTARVLVNRVWMHHFGRGIVGTPGDFGTLGERPTHPELLDWLADEFRTQGWSLKRLHKLLMTSTAYRQASTRDAESDVLDADNRLLGRMAIRRLEAETLRDAMLAVSGRLNPRPFGKPVPVRVDEVGQVVVGVDTRDSAGRPSGKVVALDGEEFRRTIYVQARRSEPLAVLEAFDLPVLEPNCKARNASTVAPQALLLMNNEFVVTQAKAFAERVRREAGDNPAAQVQRAWRLAYSREPDAREHAEALTFLAAQTTHLRSHANAEVLALASFCQALLGSNAFLYVD